MKNKELKQMMEGFLDTVALTLREMKLPRPDVEMMGIADVQTKLITKPENKIKVYCVNYCFLSEDKHLRDKIAKLLNRLAETPAPSLVIEDMNKKIRAIKYY